MRMTQYCITVEKYALRPNWEQRGLLAKMCHLELESRRLLYDDEFKLGCVYSISWLWTSQHLFWGCLNVLIVIRNQLKFLIKLPLDRIFISNTASTPLALRMYLSDYPSLLLTVVKFVFLQRVLNGDAFCKYVQTTLHCTDLADIISKIPYPSTIFEISPNFCGKTYYAALNNLRSQFDGPCRDFSITSYLDYAVENLNISESTCLLALIYVDRLINRNPHLFLSSKNFKKLVGVAIMVASKFSEDRFVPIRLFARFVGSSKTDTAALEKSFLEQLEYNLYVSDSDFKAAETGITSAVLFCTGDVTLAEKIKEKEILCVPDACKRAVMWKMYQLIPKTSRSVPMFSAFSLLHGDEIDSARMSDALSSVAEVQLENDFGPIVHDVDSLLTHCLYMTEETYFRLIQLLHLLNGSAKCSQLKREAGYGTCIFESDGHSWCELPNMIQTSAKTAMQDDAADFVMSLNLAAAQKREVFARVRTGNIDRKQSILAALTGNGVDARSSSLLLANQFCLRI